MKELALPRTEHLSSGGGLQRYGKFWILDTAELDHRDEQGSYAFCFEGSLKVYHSWSD